MDIVAAYGRWPSPLSAAQAAAAKVSLSEVASDGSSVYWLESRPAEGGRVVFVRADASGADATGAGVVDMTPEGVSIRSRVHEYGGGACCLVPHQGPGAFAYVDGGDEGVWLYRGAGDGQVALSGPPPPGERWAHGGLGASADGNWVVAVREVHGEDPGPSAIHRRPRCPSGERRGVDPRARTRLLSGAEKVAEMLWSSWDRYVRL
jgi:hypothetical protein